MHRLLFITYAFAATCFLNCQKEDDIEQNDFIPNEQTTFISNPLDGTYQGNLVIDYNNSFLGVPYGWSDTFDILFSLNLPTFQHGACDGNVAVQSDTISFDATECDCMCGCNPLVDCGGDLLIGTRLFQFDGDSLIMQAEGGSVDSISIPGITMTWYQKVVYRLKKQ